MKSKAITTTTNAAIARIRIAARGSMGGVRTGVMEVVAAGDDASRLVVGTAGTGVGGGDRVKDSVGLGSNTVVYTRDKPFI